LTAKKIWIDIINPSQVLFFHSLIPSFDQNDIILTFRKRGETTELADSLGMKGKIVGQDHSGPLNKGIDEIIRMVQLSFLAPKFDYSMSFENVMPIMASRTRFGKSIILCDNDLKLSISESKLQKIESSLKGLTNYLIAPKCCREKFESTYGDSVLYFDGFKEDVYISSHNFDKDFLSKIPFKDYVVVRPEALGSLYVRKKFSLTRDIVERLLENGKNIVYLPRDAGDKEIVQGLDVHMPDKALNGIDLCYHSECVLTGSGTMAREAACMGRKSVSYFPGNDLLSVDLELINNKKMMHSRETSKIVEYVCQNNGHNGEFDMKRMLTTRNEIIGILNQIMDC
jgi:uncharacterized protein